MSSWRLAEAPPAHGEASRSAADSYLSIEHLTVRFGSHVALEDVTLSVPHGARVAVIGPNGAGKSTLLKVLVGLVAPTSGRLSIHGRLLGHGADCLAYLPQQPSIGLRFPVTVRDVVMMGRYGELGLVGRPSAADQAWVQACMERLAIAALADRPIASLSGGQLQRTLLARALAQRPHVLLLDEPFSGVDVRAEQEFLALLGDLAREEVTVLMATHDLDVACERFDWALLLNRRCIAWGPPAAVITAENLAAAFGPRLLRMPAGGLLVDECHAPPGDRGQ